MIQDYFSRLRLFSRDTRLILATSALIGFAVWGGIYTVLLNLYLLRLGYGPRFIGLINSAGMLSVAVFSLPVGVISGSVGVRRMLIASMIPSAIGFVALPFAEFASAGLRSSLLLISYFLGYFGFTIWAVNAGPFLTAATSERERSHAFSLRQVLSALGAFVGSLVAGFLPTLFAALLGSSLEDPAPYRYALLSAGALLFTGVPLLAATGPSVVFSPGNAQEDRGRAPVALILTMSAVCLLSIIGEGAARTFFNIYLDTGLSIPTSRIGTLSAVAQLLALPAATATPLLVDRIGKQRAVLLGSAARALCLIPLALLRHWLAAGGAFVGLVMLASFSRPVFTELQLESVPPRWRAAMSGATTMAAGLSWAVASFGGGYLVAASGYGALFLVGSALSLVGVGIFWAQFAAPNQRAPGKSLALPAPSSTA